MRKTFIKTLVSLAAKNERVILITPDIGYSVLEEFQNAYPSRFFNVGIAEQNAISIAAGMALEGMIPYVYTINPFVCMRPFEQIRVDVAYMKTNVRIVGVGAGFSYGAAGATHHSIEDIAIMRALPGMTVICPGDPWEVEQAMNASLDYIGPIFLRLGKQGEPIINDITSSFKIGKATIIKEGKDLAIITTSNTLEICNGVMNQLQQKGISASLISMHTIKPFDAECVRQILDKGIPVITVEEHNIIGGLGSAVAEVIAESGRGIKFKRIGVEDAYSHYVGSHNYIREKFGISESNILKIVMELIN